jgi:hypothetical protein
MIPTVTERSNCRFTVRRQKGSDQPQLVLELFQSIPQLVGAKVGYELLGGTTIEEAKKLAAVLNERVLNLFVEAELPTRGI